MRVVSWKSHLTHRQFKENVATVRKTGLESTNGWKFRLFGPFFLLHYSGSVEEVETSTGGTAYNIPHLLLVGLCLFSSNSTRFIGLAFFHYLFIVSFIFIPFITTLFLEKSFLAAFIPWFTFYILVSFVINGAVKPILSNIKTFFCFDPD